MVKPEDVAEVKTEDVAEVKTEDVAVVKPEDVAEVKTEDVAEADAVIRKFSRPRQLPPPPGRRPPPRPPPPGPPPKEIQDAFKPKEIDPTSVFRAKNRSPAQERADAMRAEYERTRKKTGGSLKRKNKKTKRKYYVYNK